MVPISCRLDERLLQQLDRFPVSGERKLKARLKNNRVEMKALTKNGDWIDIADVEYVRIDWGLLSSSGHDVTFHSLTMLPVSRAILDEIGDVDQVVSSVEPFIEIETIIGFRIMVPLFDTGLYRRVVAFKQRK